jgi:hypothetical protein
MRPQRGGGPSVRTMRFTASAWRVSHPWTRFLTGSVRLDAATDSLNWSCVNARTEPGRPTRRCAPVELPVTSSGRRCSRAETPATPLVISGRCLRSEAWCAGSAGKPRGANLGASRPGAHDAEARHDPGLPRAGQRGWPQRLHRLCTSEPLGRHSTRRGRETARKLHHVSEYTGSSGGITATSEGGSSPTGLAR